MGDLVALQPGVFKGDNAFQLIVFQSIETRSELHGQRMASRAFGKREQVFEGFFEVAGGHELADFIGMHGQKIGFSAEK